MKKVGVILLVIIMIIMGFYTFNMYNQLIEKNKENEKLESKILEQTEQIEKIQNTLDTIKQTISDESENSDKEDKSNNSSSKVNTEIPVGKVSLDNFKASYACDDVTYEKESDMEINVDDFGINVELKDNKAFLTIDTKAKKFSNWGLNSKDYKDIQNKELEGFSANPEKIYFGGNGQDISGTNMFFIMDDQTVEYINIDYMLHNKKYESQGKIKGLSNIVGFDFVSVRRN